MRDAIVEKLGAIMCGPPESEAVVAYALVEIRKLLERDNKKGDFTTLTFFCDWVVHVKLSGTGARDALSKLDLRLANLDLNNPNNVGADGEIYRFISFEWLLQELSDFCREYKLPLKWVADPGSWRSCVKFYSQIVRDCPLDVTRTDRNTVYIQKVSLMTTDAQAPTPNVESLRLGWQFDLSDGNTFTQTGNFRHQATPAKQASRKPMTDELGF